MGSYTFCDGCDELIEFFPDVEGLSASHAARLKKMAKEHLRKVWGKP
jgi:hypothetical protein